MDIREGEKRSLKNLTQKNKKVKLSSSKHHNVSNNANPIAGHSGNTNAPEQVETLLDPAIFWTKNCPWGQSPPSDFYRAGCHPLGAIMRKVPYVPGHFYVTISDQLMIRNSLLVMWKPQDILSGNASIQTAIGQTEVIMNETIRGVLDMIWQNKHDTAFVPLFRGGRFKLNKEAIRLAIKLRFKGALHEMNKIAAGQQGMTIGSLNTVTKILWWAANFRWE